jgi:hypothetical protein
VSDNALAFELVSRSLQSRWHRPSMRAHETECSSKTGMAHRAYVLVRFSVCLRSPLGGSSMRRAATLPLSSAFHSTVMSMWTST